MSGVRDWADVRRGARERWPGLVLVGTLVVGGSPQVLPAQTAPVPGRLTLQPRAIAIGARTAKVGEHPLSVFPVMTDENGKVIQGGDGTNEVPQVYVPQQCVGPRSCPLVVFLWPTWDNVTRFYIRPMADKYGMIVLAPAMPAHLEHDVLHVRRLDDVLKHVLRTFPVDPDRLAIMGTCATGAAALFVGGENTHVFSRTISLSAGYPSPADVDPPNRNAEFLLDAGYGESHGMFRAVQELRHKGHRAAHAFSFWGHGHHWELYDFVGRWLQTSWTIPDPARRPAPAVLANPLPLLTTEALTKMTAFWTRFQQKPDSIRTAGRRAHMREVQVPIGGDQSMVTMVDMTALAAQFPAVAADLATAGLTAQQHDAYRVALASAYVTNSVGRWAGTVDPASVMGKNLAFMAAHPDEFRALQATKMWVTP